MDMFTLQQAMAARALMGTGALPFHLAQSPSQVSKPSWGSQSMGFTPRALETPSPASSSNIETSSMLSQVIARTTPRRPRGEKKPIPDEQKDDKYFERRKRNNLAAKKSRDQRKNREDSIGIRAGFLEKENALLRAQLSTLREEKNSLQTLLVIRRQIFQQKQQQQQQQQYLSQDQVLGLLMLEHQQRQLFQLQQRFKENEDEVQNNDVIKQEEEEEDVIVDLSGRTSKEGFESKLEDSEKEEIFRRLHSMSTSVGALFNTKQTNSPLRHT